MAALHEGAAGRGEHAAGVDQLFGEELGADEGMMTTETGDLLSHEETVGRDFTSDVIGSDGKHALDAILKLSDLSQAALTTEEGIGSPGGAPEDAGGVGAGGHGGDVFVVTVNEDILGFIDFEQEVGGGADDVGAGLAGEEEEASLAEAIDVAVLTRPPTTGELVGIEDTLEAAHSIDGLRFPGGGNFDHFSREGRQAGEEVGFDLGLKLVFAGLARKDDDETEASGIEDAIHHGAGDRDLVGTEREAAEVGGEDDGVEDHGGESW